MGTAQQQGAETAPLPVNTLCQGLCLKNAGLDQPPIRAGAQHRALNWFVKLERPFSLSGLFGQQCSTGCSIFLCSGKNLVPRLSFVSRRSFRPSRFPRGTGYSSAGCASAEPASASSDLLQTF